jgi:hypothetical protein
MVRRSRYQPSLPVLVICAAQKLPNVMLTQNVYLRRIGGRLAEWPVSEFLARVSFDSGRLTTVWILGHKVIRVYITRAKSCRPDDAVGQESILQTYRVTKTRLAAKTHNVWGGSKPPEPRKEMRNVESLAASFGPIAEPVVVCTTMR